MERLIDHCIDRYRTVIAIMILVVLCGTVAFINVPKESSPDVKLAMVYVSVHHEGISPEDAEKLILLPLERTLKTIEGIDEMTSNATLGHASVMLKFDAGFDSNKALQNVRAKVDEAKAKLPVDSDEPTVTEVDFSLFPVMNVMLSGNIPERTLLKIARDLRDKIEENSNILEVGIAGNREEIVEVVIKPNALESYGISTDDITAVVSASNKLVAAGSLDSGKGRYSIKVPSLFTNRNDILDLPVKTNGDAVVRVRDVAEVRKTFRDPETFAKVNGKPAVVLSVRKRVGKNILQTVEDVKNIINKEKEYLPTNLQIDYGQDQSTDIQNMLYDLVNNIVIAIILVFIITTAMVGFRLASLVSIAVPGSILIGVIFMALMGFTLNIVVLFSFILAVGILVDDAIIVGEHADILLQKGEPPAKAYAAAAKRMMWPTISRTMTILIVFSPLLFWPGVVGQFMKFMPITLMVTLTGSLFIALYVVPAIGAITEKRRQEHGIKQEVHHEVEGSLSSRYAKLLTRIMQKPGRVLLGTLAAMFLVFFLFGKFGAGFEFFPDIEPTNAIVQIKARGNLSIEEKDKIVTEVTGRILGMKEVKSFFTQTGVDRASFSSGEASEDLIGQITMEFVDWKERRKANEILAEIRERTKDLSGIIIETSKQKNGPASGKPIYLRVSSRFPEKINSVAELMLKKVNSMDGLKDIEDNRNKPEIEWKLAVDRAEAGKFGASVSSVGQFVQLVTNGFKVGSYRSPDADDEIDIILRYPIENRGISQLDNLRVNTNAGAVPVSNFVVRSAQQKVGTVYRAEGQRIIEIKADLKDGVLADTKIRELGDYIKKSYASGDIPPEVKVEFKGENEDQQKSGNFLAGAFVLALVSMFIMLLTQFNSAFAAFVIMTAVFFSTIGVLLGLLVMHEPFGVVMCGVGIIALAGVVVSNNIIFIDFYMELKKQGYPTFDALVESGKQRLRPILLTAGTAVVGLLPMVFQLNLDFIHREVTVGAPSTQWWTQLSTAIAGGLTFATALTLFFTPCLIFWAERTLGIRLYEEKTK